MVELCTIGFLFGTVIALFVIAADVIAPVFSSW
jgi:hypothetical protein